MEGCVGDVKGCIILDNEGHRIIAKYYNANRGTPFETTQQQKNFERQLFLKSSKQSASGSGASRSVNSFENDIMTVDNYVAIFRSYSDMTFFIIGHAEDNELILGLVLDCIHACFDRIFRKGIERRYLIENMSPVILVIDELLDQGVVMNLDPNTVLGRIDTKNRGAHAAPSSDTSGAAEGEARPASSSASLFSSVFSSARS